MEKDKKTPADVLDDKDLENEIDNEEIDEGIDDQDDEFEYDDEGNIIIPDVDDEDVEEEGEDTDPESQDEKSDSDENEGSDESDEVVEPDNTPNKDKERIAELEKELNLFKSQGKDTLAKLGVETDNVLEGLEKLAAEAEDTSIEEYRKKRAESQTAEEAKRLYQRTEFEKKMKADFAEVQMYFPETKNLKSLEEIDNFAEFGRLRDMGLSPKQAYAAANADNVKKSVADAVKQKSLNDTKQHLQSAVPKGSKDNSLTMPKKTLVEWRDLFPNKSDKEIVALYKKTLNQ